MTRWCGRVVAVEGFSERRLVGRAWPKAGALYVEVRGASRPWRVRSLRAAIETLQIHGATTAKVSLCLGGRLSRPEMEVRGGK